MTVLGTLLSRSREVGRAALADARAGASEVTAFGTELLAATARTKASRVAIRELQERRIAAVLDAAMRTPLRRGERLRHLGDARPITKGELIARLEETVVDPSLTRARLVGFATGGEGQPGEAILGRYVVATTSGTTGEVGIFVDDVAGWARQRGVVFARIFQGMLKPEGFLLLAQRRYRLAFVIATGGHTLTSILASRVPRIGRTVADSRVFPIDDELPATVAALNAFEPMLLHSYPTVLEVLAYEKRRGALRIEPEIITAGSEPMTQQARDALRAAFPNARLVETYAATECVAMATACPHGAVHVNEDACVLEPVDDELRPVPLGTAGSRVLVTNLLNTVQPLVRYELRDSVRLLDEPCPCGSPFHTVKVEGRTDDTFFLVDAQGRVQSHPPIPIEVSLFGIAGLLQWQVVHEAQNRLRVAFVVESGADPAAVARALDDRIGRYLEAHGLLSTTTYLIEQQESIERHQRSKKLRQILSRVARPPAVDVVPASTVRSHGGAP